MSSIPWISLLKTIKVAKHQIKQDLDLETNLGQMPLREHQTELDNHNQPDLQECLHPQDQLSLH